MRKTLRWIVAAVCAFVGIAAEAQEDGFLWSVDFNTVFDNREGDKTYSPQGTIFFARISPEIGVRFLKDHEIKGGVSYIQPIGIGWERHKFCPTFYYTFTQPRREGWRVSVGMLPRHMMRQQEHRIMMSDSMTYQNPNIRGVLLQCLRDSFFAEIVLDWRSLQSEVQREAFSVTANVEGMPTRLLYVGGHLRINHLAKQENAPEGQGVNDDIFLNPYVGLDLKSVTPLDSFRIQAGLAQGMERCRALGGWETPTGLLVDVVAEWKKIGVKESLYCGKNQFPLYPLYGSLLNMGEPFYQAKMYSYTSLYAKIVRNEMVNFDVALDLNVTKAGLACYQKILLRCYLDRDRWRHRGDGTYGAIANIY